MKPRLAFLFSSFLFIFLVQSNNSFAQEKIELEEVQINANTKLNNSIQYEKLKNMPESGVFSFGVTVENDKLYVMSGDVSNVGVRTKYRGFSNKIYIYDQNQTVKPISLVPSMEARTRFLPISMWR